MQDERKQIVARPSAALFNAAMVNIWRRFQHKLKQFRALGGERKWEFWADWFSLQLLAVRFRIFGFKRVAKSVKKHAERRPACSPPEDVLEFAKESARLVDAAARNSLFGKNCLRESLILWSRLKRTGIDSNLRIGAPLESKSGSDWEAHAWVELDGRILNDRPNVREKYAQFSGFAEAWESL